MGTGVQCGVGIVVQCGAFSRVTLGTPAGPKGFYDGGRALFYLQALRLQCFGEWLEKPFGAQFWPEMFVL